MLTESASRTLQPPVLTAPARMLQRQTQEEAIITALSRIRWLFVIARNSSFTYRGQAIDVKQVRLSARSIKPDLKHGPILVASGVGDRPSSRRRTSCLTPPLHPPTGRKSQV
jgi:hypothetical protein